MTAAEPLSNPTCRGIAKPGRPGVVGVVGLGSENLAVEPTACCNAASRVGTLLEDQA